MNYGFSYINEAHCKACGEHDKRLVGELPDDYLATFLAHFAAGKLLPELPNPLLCPHPWFLVAEAKARGWDCKEADGKLLINLPDQARVLSPPPTELPRKARRRAS